MAGKRTINKSHRQYVDLRYCIRSGFHNSNHDDFWETKYYLAGNLAAKYGVEIGIVNHLIEQEARRVGQR